MAYSSNYVPCSETGYFSRLVTDYLESGANIKPFYQFSPDKAGMEEAIAARSKYKIDRQALVDTLKKQYAGLQKYPLATSNIESLLSEDTFTVCTAHQPNLLTGYLYFVYKILHAVKLADELNVAHPGKHFVPVYYMGSEDNDLAELGTFRFRGDKYVWDGDGQKGAVGRMATKSLKKTLNDLFRVFGPPGQNCDELKELFTNAYLGHKTVGAATQYLVSELFGRYGLVALDPDEVSFKRSFIPVMEDELLHQASNPIIEKQIALLGTHYKIQAHPREINLFYLVDGLRERIERNGESWVVVHSDITWSKDELLKELYDHPERFSPNVMLRGLFQETILPDVAFIGGGAEVAYWMQLKTLFEHYKGFFPVVLLRQSVLWINPATSRLRAQLSLSLADIFKPEQELGDEFVKHNTQADWQTGAEAAAMEELMHTLKSKVTAVDTTLGPAAEVVINKMKHQLAVLEKKMLRAEKQKMEVQRARIAKLKAAIFPNKNLQERVENFSEYYLQYGPAFFDALLKGIDTSGAQFLVITDEG